METKQQRTDRPFDNHLDIRRVIFRETGLKTTYVIEGQVISHAKPETIVANKATECGASGELFAVLLRIIPSLLIEVQSADLEATVVGGSDTAISEIDRSG